MNKIFGIGLSKTGTNSLTSFVKTLGFSTNHYVGMKNFYDKVKEYDFVSDVPVCTRFKELDKRHPNSKFILTVREINSWINSCKNHFDDPRKTEARKEEFYGAIQWNRRKFLKTYMNHIKDVKKYFDGRENDLLIVDIIGGESPHKVANFLNKSTSKKEFPKKNVRSYGWKKKYCHQILMNDNEIAMIRKYLQPDDVMLEWGSGGSTWYFPLFVRKYYSIEHKRKWYDKIRSKIIPTVNMYLQPANKQTVRCHNRFEYKDYIEKIHKLGVEKFDKVLIDGRGRKFCAEEVLPYLKKDSIVFIHDFRSRKRYHSVLKYYKIIEEIKTGKELVVLKKKS